MKEIPYIDLHPRSMPGKGPETALNAAREFIREQLKRGLPEARIVTGLGLHGDGTPRLRRRVEADVLPAFQDRIEEAFQEQGGAVIHLRFRKNPENASPAHARHLQKEASHKRDIAHEERLGVAGERLDRAWESLNEGDLRKAKLKTSQLLREFMPLKTVTQDIASLRNALDELESFLEAKGL